MDAKDILPMIFGRSDALQTYWNLFIAVSVGGIGLIAGSTFKDRRKANIIASVAFILFAVSNCFAIKNVVDVRRELVNILNRDTTEKPTGFTAGDFNTMERMLRPNPDSVYVGFHLFFDLLVVGAIWLVPGKLPEHGERRGARRE